VHPRPFVRAIAILLLAWIAVDFAALDTCVFEACREADGGHGGAPSVGTAAAPHAALPHHPDDCLCHGLGLEPGRPAGLSAPTLIASAIASVASARPLDTPSALYHPPQLHA